MVAAWRIRGIKLFMIFLWWRGWGPSREIQVVVPRPTLWEPVQKCHESSLRIEHV